jgi:hypothetical protein
MQTIGIKAAKRYFRRQAPQIRPRAVLVLQDEFATSVKGGQDDDQSGEHAGSLLGIAMAEEEAVLIVDEELIELRLHRLTHAQAFGGACHNGRQAPSPVAALKMDPISADLPHPSYPSVDQGFLAASIRSTFGNGDKLCSLV